MIGTSVGYGCREQKGSRCHSVSRVIELDAASFLLQWSVGGMLGCWFTTRRREIGVGYGWLLRVIFGILAVAATWVGWSSGEQGTAVQIRNLASTGTAIAVIGSLGLSLERRRLVDEGDRKAFPPVSDIVALVPGTIGLVAAAVMSGGNDAVATVRLVVGAAFLGFVTDSMLLGHWYLVQPGLPRRHVRDIVRAFLFLWPLEVLVMLVPTGMISVLSGSIDDGWGGLLGWFWVACAVTTGVLGVVTMRALDEPSYSAVMAATGLMYLAILTAFGTDLVARATLS